MEELNDKEKVITDQENVMEIVEETVQHLNNPVNILQPIVKRYLTAVKEVKQTDNKFYFSDGEASRFLLCCTGGRPKSEYL
jgi:alpha-glucosidase